MRAHAVKIYFILCIIICGLLAISDYRGFYLFERHFLGLTVIHDN